MIINEEFSGPRKIKSETVGALIGRYNTFGERLANNISLRELAEELLQIAEAAEYTITNEQADDWYDAKTISRHLKELRTYANEVFKIGEEYDTLHMRARALVDDCGHVLQRYFENGDPETSHRPTYDTGTDELQPDNAPKKPVDPDELSQMGKYHERFDESGEKFQHLTHQLAGKGAHDPKALAAYIGREKLGKDEFQKKAEAGKNEVAEDSGYAKQLTERLVALARHKLTGEQLSRFDVLPKEMQIRAAWKVVR